VSFSGTRDPSSAEAPLSPGTCDLARKLHLRSGKNSYTWESSKMKNMMCLALIFLAFPASAQKAANPHASAKADDVVGASVDYAARVDGLLREVHSSLQKISARMEAGQLTPEQAADLKLAATRDMISRLDALAAAYDVRLDSKAKNGMPAGSVAANGPVADDSVHTIVNTNTVSVEDLKREANAAATPRLEKVIR
jgi:hypothetical protein